MNIQPSNHFAYQISQIYSSTTRIRWCVALLVALLIAAVVWAALTRVDTVIVGTGSICENLVRDKQSELPNQPSALITGTVAEIFVYEGMPVHKGDALLRIDVSDLESDFAIQLSTIAGITKLMDELDREQIAVRLQQKRWDEPSAIDLDLSRRLVQLDSELEIAREQLLKLQMQKDRSIVYASCEGIVSLLDVRTGDGLKKNEKIPLKITPPEKLIFEALIPTYNCQGLQTGLAAEVCLETYDRWRYRTVTGEVIYVSQHSVKARNKQGQLREYYVVKIKLNDNQIGDGADSAPIRLSMTGYCEIKTGHTSNLDSLVGNWTNWFHEP